MSSALSRRACGRGWETSLRKLHHIIDRSRNGKTVIDNLALVCWSCQGLHHLGRQVTRGPDGSYAITKRSAD